MSCGFLPQKTGRVDAGPGHPHVCHLSLSVLAIGAQKSLLGNWWFSSGAQLPALEVKLPPFHGMRWL